APHRSAAPVVQALPVVPVPAPAPGLPQPAVALAAALVALGAVGTLVAARR
ncbi:MAG: hypothetical protein JWN17_3103, partial [Frankiales bacterium]|nr:hypothetical protein [Frankiales bacterium]